MLKRRWNYVIISCAFALSNVFGQAPSATSSDYSITNRIHLGGEGGWDCCELDDASGRLFVSHDMQVHVVNVATHAQIGVISDTKGVHDIAFARDLNKMYISDGKDSSVTVADFKTLTVVKKVRVTGADPDAIIYDPFSHCIFAFNGKSENATVIDTKSDKVVATIALNGSPEFAASNGAGLVYNNLEDKGEVAVINTKTMKVEKKWSVAPAEKPCAMAIDNHDHRLFIGCRSKVMIVLDAATGKTIASLPIGDHVDAAEFDPATQRIYCSNGDGTVTVIQKSGKDTYKVLENIVTQKGAKTMALSTTTHHLYLPAAEYNPAPAPTAEKPHPRASVKPGSFEVLEIAPVGK